MNNASFRIHADPNMPPDEIQVRVPVEMWIETKRDADTVTVIFMRREKVIGRIVNIGTP